MDAYLKLDKVNRAYLMVKANLPATFDAAWHTTNDPKVTINTFETFFKSSVYSFDAIYPGLQIPPVVTGETAPTNAARATVYASYMGKIEPASVVVVDTTDSSFSNTFEQYRMEFYM